MSKETSKELASLAAVILNGYEPTPAEIKTLAASCLTQREDDPGDVSPDDRCGVPGMTLRDWFAGQALAGMNADGTLDMTASNYASVCYDHADAMIEAREGGE